MSFTVGRVAKLSGLSVRSLHHYDEIGLLVPSQRSESGYRLYSHTDVQRLYRIQALRQLGWSLSQVQQTLDREDISIADVLEQQIVDLDREISRASELRSRVVHLRDQLSQQRDLSPEALLGTAELFGHYDKHLSQDELQRLSLISDEDKDEWRSAYADAVAAFERNVAPSTDEARAIAHRWIGLTWRQVGGDVDLAYKLKSAYRNSAGVRASMTAIAGIDPAVMQFIWAAIHDLKVAGFAQHFSEEEMARFDFSDDCAMERTRIVAELRAVLVRAASVDDPSVQANIDQLNSNLDDFVSHDAPLRRKLDAVLERDQTLRASLFESDALYEFIRAAQRARVIASSMDQ